MRWLHTIAGSLLAVLVWVGFQSGSAQTIRSTLELKPLTDADFRKYPEAQVRLGQLLFYDRVLSGTYRVSCATCHNHDRASSNGFLLPGRKALEGEVMNDRRGDDVGDRRTPCDVHHRLVADDFRDPHRAGRVGPCGLHRAEVRAGADGDDRAPKF